MKSVKIKIFIMALLLAVSYKAYSQTELYKQYEHRTEFTVMCIMKCPINDSLKIDVTLFVPNSKEELWPMVEEFNLGLNKDTVLDRYKREKTYPLYGYNVYKDDIKKIYVKKSDEDYKNMFKQIAIAEYNPNDPDNKYIVSRCNEYTYKLNAIQHDSTWLHGEDNNI